MRFPLLVALGAAVIGVPLLVLVALVDDWSRDLGTNVAATAADAADPLLRPLEVQRSLAQAVALVESTASQLPRWEVAARRSLADGVEVRLVRATRWLRFEDDVTVTIRDLGAVREVSAVSRSRVGKGDLGQNPRNLRELFAALRAADGLSGG